MPRKSIPSTSVGDITVPSPSAVNGAAGLAQAGDMSTMSPATDPSATTKSKMNIKAPKEDPDSVGVDDLLLPRTLISRLARGILPANTSIQKDALLALTKAATVFISYLAHNANDLTQKKTVGPQDVLKAIQEVEMGGLMGLGGAGADSTGRGRLEKELEVFESVVRGKRKGYREKVKARESGLSNLSGGREGEDGQESEQREAKRARLEEEEEEEEEEDERDQNGRLNQDTRRHGMAKTGHMLSLPPRPHHATARAPAPSVPNAKRAAPQPQNIEMIPDDDPEDNQDDQDDDNTADEEADNVPSEEDDEDQDEGGEEDEDEDEDERKAEEDELDSYGPDDQLRHDMNGGEAGDDDDDNGSGDESD